MLPEERDKSALLDMIEQCQGISATVKDKSFTAYCADDNLRYAIERRIEILGEAAKHLSDSIRMNHPEIPWQEKE